MKKLLLITCLLFSSAYAQALWQENYSVSQIKKNPKQANLDLLSYINANPSDGNGWYMLGLAYLAQNQYKDAQNAFKKAYNLSLNNQNIDKIDFPNNEYDNLEDYFDMAQMYYENQNFQEALNYADMMLKIDPDSASAYFIKAKIAKIQNNPQQATEYLKKAIFLNNSLLNTNLAGNLKITKLPILSKEEYIVLAQRRYFQGNLDGAIENLKNYIDVDNKNPDVYAFLADCYIKQDKIEEASNIVEKGLMESKNADLLLKKAQIQKINAKDSKETLLSAYSYNPNSKEVVFALGKYYLEKEDYENAKKYFEKLTIIDNSMYEAYFGYTYSLIQLGQIKEAISSVKIASNLNKSTSEIEYLLSQICYAQASYKDALEYIDSALKKEKSPVYFYDGAKYAFLVGDYQKSLDYLKNISNHGILEALNYIKLKQYNSAKLSLKNVTILDKNSKMYKYVLYVLNKYENDDKEALKNWDEIMRAKLESLNQYMEMAQIYALVGDVQNCEKILETASKKYKNSLINKQQN